VHVPMLETMVAFNLADHLWHGALAEPEKGIGYPRMLTEHRRPFPTKDGHICILATTDLQSRHLFEAIEGKFYSELLRRLDIDPATLPAQMDREHWPEAKSRLSALFKTRTREEWCGLLEGTDACFAPVLTTDEAPEHPHNKLRGTYVEIDGIVQPAPAPRFSRTVADLPIPPQHPAGAKDADAILADWLDPAEIAAFRAAGTIE